jgi:hypothetical protein
MNTEPTYSPFLKKAINVAMIFFFMFISVILIFYIIYLWPDGEIGPKKIFKGITLSAEQRMLILVALGGALGAFIHISTSFTDFIGNQKLVYSWLPWYIIRPFIGSALAIIFYFLVRGGLIAPQVADSTVSSSDTSTISAPYQAKFAVQNDSLVKLKPVTTSSDNQNHISSQKSKSTEFPPLNPFGIIAISCMAGLFSKQAIDKLREVFETLFKIKEKTPRKDPLDNSLPNDDSSKLSKKVD